MSSNYLIAGQMMGFELGMSQEYITFEEFSKVQLKIGKVVSAEKIPGMNKVFRAIIDIGGETRELAVGAAQFYQPEEFVGRTVVICTNLEPKKIGGIISQGMLLAADGPNGKPLFLTVTEEAPLGSRIH
jgi:methionine--tRNA ligase beta chain